MNKDMEDEDNEKGQGGQNISKLAESGRGSNVRRRGLDIKLATYP